MIDEPPQALESTLSTTHNLYILSLAEQKQRTVSALKEKKKQREGGQAGREERLGWQDEEITSMTDSALPSSRGLPSAMAAWVHEGGFARFPCWKKKLTAENTPQLQLHFNYTPICKALWSAMFAVTFC